jgi:ABC-type transport system involved in cytochrome bd biosynthesis fused ATPase/permease subunit
MELNTILLISILLILLVVLIITLITRKNKNNSKEFINEFNTVRQELSTMLMQTREELSKNIGNKINENANTQQTQLANLTNLNETKLENTRKNMDLLQWKIRQV